MKKVICISGKARAGKDTFAATAANELTKFGYNCIIIHYADLLKWMCRKFLGWDGKKDEDGRAMLQYVGTDIVRKIKPDFWTNFVTDFILFFNEYYDYIIIPDVRFPNEVECIKNNGWEVDHIRIERPDNDNNLTDNQRKHISENAMNNYPSDLIIINCGTLEAFKEMAETYAEGEAI